MRVLLLVVLSVFVAGELEPRGGIPPGIEGFNMTFPQPPIGQAVRDTNALMVFYNSTNGEGWDNNTNWMDGGDCCRWFGIRCDNEDFVSGIELPNNGLTGVLPDNFDEYSNLRVFNISGNSVNGDFPASFGQVPLLQVIDIENNLFDMGATFDMTDAQNNSLIIEADGNGFTGPLDDFICDIASYSFAGSFFNCINLPSCCDMENPCGEIICPSPSPSPSNPPFPSPSPLSPPSPSPIPAPSPPPLTSVPMITTTPTPVLFSPSPSPPPSPNPSPSSVPSPSPTPIPFPTPTSTPTPSSIPIPTPTSAPVPTPTSAPPPPPTPTPTIDFEAYFSAVICYFGDVVCDPDYLAALAQACGNAAGNTVEVLEDTCEDYENYCSDFNGWDGFNLKRQSNNRRSVLITSSGFATDADAQTAFNNLQQSIQNGNIAGAAGISEVNCGDCDNQCDNCNIRGEWNRGLRQNCDRFDQCPAGEGDAVITVRTVVDFRSEDVSGQDRDLIVNQYWDFPEDKSCTTTWSAVYRFYSDASECATRIGVESGSCDSDCDSGTPEGFRDMVCDRDNLILENELANTNFFSDCDSLDLQGFSYAKGGVSNDDNDDDDDDSDSGASGAGLSLFLVVLVAFFARFY